MNNIAIFASGNGTNAQALIDHFKENTSTRIALLVSNKPNAYVIKRADVYNIPVEHINRQSNIQNLIKTLQHYQINWIILAGYLALIPSEVIIEYPQHIINLHPALLPKFGGKGMYGEFVHRAVLTAHETHSGITIHYVNEQYDSGATIFQASCPVLSDDTPETLAKRIHILEHTYLPIITELLIKR